MNFSIFDIMEIGRNKLISRWKNCNEKNISFVLAVFLILLYTAVGIILLLHHEPWEDEAQAWLIARDLDIVSIFKQMAYEGTPALWHVLLVPFAKSGTPYISEFILHLIIAVAAVAVFLLYAPFSTLTKVLFIFSYYMAYEYSIIARSYGLSILLLFIIAALYNRRFEHPIWHAFLIFFLFNTNVHSFFMASSLAILFAWELYRKKVQGGRKTIAVLILFTGGLLCLLQLLSPSDNINYGIITEVNLLAPLVAVASAFFPWHTSQSYHSFIPIELQKSFIIMAFIMFYIIILSIKREPAALFILLFSFAGLFYIFAFKYPGALRHNGLLFIILLFTIWISKYYKTSDKISVNTNSKINIRKISMIIINISLAFSLLYALRVQYLEYKYIFSGAKKMSEFIKNKRLDHFTIVAHLSCPAASLLPYFRNKNFWYADIEDYGTFITFNRKYLAGMNISNEEVISRTKKRFPYTSQILILLTTPVDFPESHDLQLLYKVDKDIFGYGREKFYLYRYHGRVIEKKTQRKDHNTISHCVLAATAEPI